MSHSSISAAAVAAASGRAAADPAAAIVAAAQFLLPHLESGRRVDAAILRVAMESAFGASDADGAWTWKTAYEACELGALLIGWAADRLRSCGISLGTLLGSLATLFIAAQLHWSFAASPLWAMIAAAGAGTVLSFAILTEYFPKELTGRANAALNVFHMGGAFALQCLTGFVIQAWAKHDGHYPEVAYQAAFSINLLLQAIALLWFSLPWLQSLASAIRTTRYPVTTTAESTIRFGMKKHTTLYPDPHPQTPFMRCLTCGSIRPLEDRLMPMVARPAI